SLTEVAEDLALSTRGLALQERQVEATRSRYFDGGDVSFDRYTQTRRQLEQQRLQSLALQRQQVRLTAQRWVVAGHVEALLDSLYAHERTIAEACRTLSPEPSRRTP
ncbi:MAG: hypothetical protein AAF602_19970, partial [Myxococcota bacterium]